MPRPLLRSAAAALAPLLVVAVACGGDDNNGSSGSAGTSGSSGGTSGSSGSGPSGSSGGMAFSTEPKTGVATFYDYSGGSEVACSFDKTFDAMITAIDPGEFAKSNACGACVAVSGPNGKITVHVVDLCPGCEDNHLDLSAEAFAKIADPKAGRVPITYQTVACDVSGNMSYRFKEGSSQYWTAIQVRNHRLPITKLEYKKDGTYTDMARADYNYFIDQQGVGKQPSGLAIRITAADGQVVEDTIAGGVQDGQVVDGAAQFK